VPGVVKALEVNRTYPSVKALSVQALLDGEKKVVPSPILYRCAHKLLASRLIRLAWKTDSKEYNQNPWLAQVES
jgi:hypothetical protein